MTSKFLPKTLKSNFHETRRDLIATVTLTAAFLMAICCRTETFAEKCPNIVANKETKIFQSGTAYECFKDAQTASASEYQEDLISHDFNHEGWWRVAVKPLKKPEDNTCMAPTGSGATNVFIQVKKNSDGIFGEVCGVGAYAENPLRLVGTAMKGSSTSLLLTAVKELPVDPFCENTASLSYIILEFGQIEKGKSGKARQTELKRCLALDRTCRTIYEGIANFEADHTHFPKIPASFKDLKNNCDFVQKQCLDCHKPKNTTSPQTSEK